MFYEVTHFYTTLYFCRKIIDCIPLEGQMFPKNLVILCWMVDKLLFWQELFFRKSNADATVRKFPKFNQFVPLIWWHFVWQYFSYLADKKRWQWKHWRQTSDTYVGHDIQYTNIYILSFLNTHQQFIQYNNDMIVISVPFVKYLLLQIPMPERSAMTDQVILKVWVVSSLYIYPLWVAVLSLVHLS